MASNAVCWVDWQHRRNIVVGRPDRAEALRVWNMALAATPEVTPEVERMVLALMKPMTRQELQSALDLRDEKHFREHYLQTGVQGGVIAMTIPDKPRSRLQRYRLTALGVALRRRLEAKHG